MASSKQTELEVKGQCRIGIMKIHDTLSHGDKPMCQIWYNNVKVKKTVTGQIRICTNRRMDKRTDEQTDGESDYNIPLELYTSREV